MKKNSYIGITFIILVFGIIFIPKIVDRVQNDDIVDLDRMSNNTNNFETTVSSEEELVAFNEVPDFNFINQNGDEVDNNY